MKIQLLEDIVGLGVTGDIVQPRPLLSLRDLSILVDTHKVKILPDDKLQEN